ncbi:MAG: 2-isopropylmalate synthase [Anaerolineae bacterium]|jgi:2-isopropylmalate synthase|nr:2-isopropylmalate synthase [Anaerolineae bacterium]
MDESGVSPENHVRIFDTTLRDGEQSPGASLTSAEKIDIARQLARLGVDIIEAGFPAASPDDLEGVRRIAHEVGTPDGPIICGLARATRGDIDKAWEAIKDAAKPRIHTFLATSDIHMKHKLRMTREQVVERTRDMVAYARSFCDDVEFSPEDACRSDPDFLVEVLGVAIEAGATTLNIPDTVGYITPDEYGALMRKLIHETPGGDRVIWSVHCHDDLGMATANSLAGLVAGARQAEVTINGIGERAGNTSLEEIVMALRTRPNMFDLTTRIDTTQLTRTSRMVSNFTGIMVQPNKAVVGANAFSHEAGIHQDGMLKHQATYEIMTPEDVGLTQSNLVLGKHSGRHAFRVRLQELGYEMDGEDLNQAFIRFKELADKKKTVTDADIEALIADEFYGPEEVFHLEGIQVACGQPGMPTATIRLRGPDDRVCTCAAIGTGPVDAVYQAIDQIIAVPNTLVEYRVSAITEGIDALGEVTVRIRRDENGGQTFGGHGADTDIIVASAKAYLSALNKMLAITGYQDHAPEGAAATIRVGTST